MRKTYNYNGKPTKLARLLKKKNVKSKELHARTVMISDILMKRFSATRYFAPITKADISLMVTGKKQNVQTDNILKICYALGCTPNDIIWNVMDEEGQW